MTQMDENDQTIGDPSTPSPGQVSPQHIQSPHDCDCRDDLCLVMYTSGTSGQPKGVNLTHGNLVSNILGVKVRPDLSVTPDHRTSSGDVWSHRSSKKA
jgi:long-chain acyl-CoA synthetase